MRIRGLLLALLFALILAAFGAAAGLREEIRRRAPTPTAWISPVLPSPSPLPTATPGWWREMPTPWRTR